MQVISHNEESLSVPAFSCDGSGLLKSQKARFSDFEMLRQFRHLETLELMDNGLTKLDFPFLVNLNLAGNNLFQLKIKIPENLQNLNLSNNLFETYDFSEHRYLIKCDLSGNKIKSIMGFDDCHFLTRLNLENNMIEMIENLDHLPLLYLNLKSNNIRSVSGLSNLSNLEELNLANNKISSISGLEDGHDRLIVLDLSENKIDDSEELEFLSSVKSLRRLKLSGNPIVPKQLASQKEYRLRTVHALSHLTNLDEIAISSEEKVAALNRFSPPAQVIASSHHTTLVKKHLGKPAKIKAIDLMQSSRLRPIVLCGPSGVGKRTLTKKLLDEFPHIFGLSISHTTRKPRGNEENGVHYHFITKQEMEEEMEKGSFVETVTLFGHIYGTSFRSIDKVTEEGKVCIIDLETEGVLSIKKSHLKPRYIFVTVPNVDSLHQRFYQRAALSHPEVSASELSQIYDSIMKNGLGKHSPLGSSGQRNILQTEIGQWLIRAEAAFNNQYNIAEFFDFKIINDNLEKAYSELKEYCLGVYLEHDDE